MIRRPNSGTSVRVAVQIPTAPDTRPQTGTTVSPSLVEETGESSETTTVDDGLKLYGLKQRAYDGERLVAQVLMRSEPEAIELFINTFGPFPAGTVACELGGRQYCSLTEEGEILQRYRFRPEGMNPPAYQALIPKHLPPPKKEKPLPPWIRFKRPSSPPS